jgi:hypothetical protein
MRIIILIYITFISINANDFINGYLNEGEAFGDKFEIQPVDEVNTKGFDFGPVLSADGKRLYFVK